MKYAVICDLDGTIALIHGRNPFEPETVLNDELNTPVAVILEALLSQRKYEITIIFVSGRFERYREQTIAWLTKHNLPAGLLYMRKNGDRRKDYIVKRELYERHIKNQYSVLFVLDDRDQTVHMWRNTLGLTCLQVAYGNF